MPLKFMLRLRIFLRSGVSIFQGQFSNWSSIFELSKCLVISQNYISIFDDKMTSPVVGVVTVDEIKL